MKIVKSKETPLKNTIIEYVGTKLDPDDGEVTFEMVASVLAEEFPEVVALMAEENYVRGYHQAAHDSEEFEKSYAEFHKETASQ